MSVSETAVDSIDLDRVRWSVHNLRDQVRELEAALLRQRNALEESQNQTAAFQTAAVERLQAIEEAERILHARAETIRSLESQVAGLQAQVETLTGQLAAEQESHARELVLLDNAGREARRGLEEVAARERILAAENLELRSERPLHSFFRWLRTLLL